MATQIIWDEDPVDVVKPPEPVAYDNYGDFASGKPPSTYKELLAMADINDLIYELNKRGMVVTARTGVYMPATVSTSPYAQTAALGGSVYTVPTTTSATTLLGLGALQGQATLTSGIYQQLLGAVDASKNKW